MYKMETVKARELHSRDIFVLTEQDQNATEKWSMFRSFDYTGQAFTSAYGDNRAYRTGITRQTEVIRITHQDS